MSLIIEIVLLNVYYIGVAVALIVRDILWLRSIMIFAATSLICYGYMADNRVVIAWNILFVSINIVQVVRLIIERKPVKVGEEIADIYVNLFSEMTAQEFLYLWNHGMIRKVENTTLCTEGDLLDDLYLMISGIASVRKHGSEIANLVRGNFIGEMGFITQEPASADVVAEGEVQYISWPRDIIYHFKKTHPEIYNKLQKIISMDLVKKIQVYQ